MIGEDRMSQYDEISAFTAVEIQTMCDLVAPVDLENQEFLKSTLEAHGCTIVQAGEVFTSEMSKEAVLLKITFPEKTMKHVGIFSTPCSQLYTVIFPDDF